ncbi:type II toxin-antitoxin system YafQ family toxin [Campylobacter avium]|uniref:type II toxin-antitoxin system YafQ family toxin n=1 Tax=Campylobacter avium TaxID=522485 RepID=UPI00255B4D4E|nr:type II toxin-antitoxin system YafQ family toxin [Campylobacter avium]
MLYEVRVSKEYKRAYKKISKKDSVLIDNVVEKLSKDEPLEAKYKDHQLKGNYKGFRECHIKPDLLLIYRKNKDILELYLASLGSHSYVF